MKFLIRIFFTAIAVALTSYLLPGVIVHGFWDSILVSVLLAILNVTLRPILIVLTIPVTVFTLGLFLLVINALMVLLADSLIGGFQVNGLGWAILFSIILTIINSILQGLAGHDQPRNK